jgi:hypothetical protein
VRLAVARHVWLAAGVGALALWAQIWFICTRENAERLLRASVGHPSNPELAGKRQIAEWMGAWLHDPQGGETLGGALGLHGSPHAALAQIALVVVLFAAGTGWAVRAIPPTARRWPVTWLACWALSMVAAVVATGAVSLVRSWDTFAWGLVVAMHTGAGAPLLAAFGLVAAGVATAVAAVARGFAPADKQPDERVLPGVPPDARTAAWASAALTGVLGAVLIGLCTRPVLSWALGDGEGVPRVSLGLVRWLMPGYWTWTDEGIFEPGVSWGYSVLALLVQLLLAGGLFWAALRGLRRPSLPAVLLTALWTGVFASLGARLLGDSLSLAASDLYDQSAAETAQGVMTYLPGVITVALLSGLAAWLILRRLPGPVPADTEPGGSEPESAPRGDGPDDEPDDELLITVSR